MNCLYFDFLIEHNLLTPELLLKSEHISMVLECKYIDFYRRVKNYVSLKCLKEKLGKRNISKIFLIEILNDLELTVTDLDIQATSSDIIWNLLQHDASLMPFVSISATLQQRFAYNMELMKKHITTLRTNNYDRNEYVKLDVYLYSFSLNEERYYYASWLSRLKELNMRKTDKILGEYLDGIRRFYHREPWAVTMSSFNLLFIAQNEF